MIRTYVNFLFPGSFFSESSVKHVADRNLTLEVPKGAYAFYFYDRQEIEANGETLTGQATNLSKTYYPGGEKLTLAQVKALPGNNDILVSNMETNKYKFVVRSRRGNFQPFDPEKDALL